MCAGITHPRAPSFGGPANTAPQDDPISVAELAKFDGSDPSKPIYVAIKGRVYDVSAKTEMYGKGSGYNVFAGKDASRGLGECDAARRQPRRCEAEARCW